MRISHIGAVVGFSTDVGAWLRTSFGLGLDNIGLLFMMSGPAAVVASPLSGWLSDHAGKRNVIIWANVVLAALFVFVSGSALGVSMVWGLPP